MLERPVSELPCAQAIHL